jgi:hypothetical protein
VALALVRGELWCRRRRLADGHLTQTGIMNYVLQPMVAGQNGRIVLVYAPTQNAFYVKFARRMYLACREGGIRAELVSSDSVYRLPPGQVQRSTAVLVNPQDLVYSLPDRAPFYEALPRFRSCIMVLAEAVETNWFAHQFRLPVPISAFVDVGFVPQKVKLNDQGYSQIVYKFLFNGLLRSERERIAAINATESARRPIPWAFIGHKTLERVSLARWLVEEVDAKGAIFLPNQGRGMRPGSGAISPLGMDLLLRKSRYYVWMAHHEFAYYESFRFREAVLNGAVPVKLDSKFQSEHSSIPGIVSSREELASFLAEGNYVQAYEAARAYYLDHKGLEDELREVLLDEI